MVTPTQHDSESATVFRLVESNGVEEPTPVQLEALKALYTAVHKATGIPLKTPKAKTTESSCVSGKYKGYINHYHLTRGKIDCAGLNISSILEDIKNGK